VRENGIVVAGAGVIGLSLAYELAGRGARVTLLDRSEPGRACSWAGAGILTPASAAGARRPIDRLRALSLELLAAWSRELRDETGIDNEYLPCGALEVAVGEGELPALERTAADWRAQGVDIEEVPPAALAELEPALSPEVASRFIPTPGSRGSSARAGG
jgi:glycine oxidase